MRRARIFARRNLKEMMRDKVGCVFFGIFPLALLGMFRIIALSVETPMPLFATANLLPGILVFAYTFVMLYTALLVAKDKSSAFLLRLYSSPMKAGEYLLGYTAPGVTVGILQALVCFGAGELLLYIEKGKLLPISILPKLFFATLPALLFFIFVGIFFGSSMSEKAAPGVSSILISLSGILSGAWMPLENMGKLEVFATYLPFYPAVRMGRYFTEAKNPTFLRDGLVVLAYAIVMLVVAILSFRAMTKKDNR